MKIQYHILPLPKRLHGWKRVVRRASSILHGTLVVQLGRVTLQFAD